MWGFVPGWEERATERGEVEIPPAGVVGGEWLGGLASISNVDRAMLLAGPNRRKPHERASACNSDHQYLPPQGSFSNDTVFSASSEGKCSHLYVLVW